MSTPPTAPDPAPIDFDAEAFLAYLRALLSPSVALTYSQYVRAALRAGISPFDNDAFQTYVGSYRPMSRGARRAAWRHYQRSIGVADVLPAAVSGPSAAAGPDSLDDFADWLARERGISVASVPGYVSGVRVVLKHLGPHPTRDQIEEFLKTRPIGYRSKLPTYWRAYQEFTQDPQLASLEADVSDVPDDVAYAAWYLAVRIGMQRQHLRQLAWRHLHESHDPPGWDVAYLPDPQPATFYRQRIDEPSIIVALRSWSLPDNDDAPVIPGTRGGSEPALQNRLRDIVTRGAELAAKGYRMGHVAIRERPDLGDVPWAVK